MDAISWGEWIVAFVVALVGFGASVRWLLEDARRTAPRRGRKPPEWISKWTRPPADERASSDALDKRLVDLKRGQNDLTTDLTDRASEEGLIVREPAQTQPRPPPRSGDRS